MKKNLKERFADSFSVSKEIIMDTVHISMAGNREIYIENYRGIVEYKKDIIRISIKDGVLCISGSDLAIQSIRITDIFISGYIETVEFKLV
ncbi:MAG: sporulation protein YqfC [Clostridia bacterium]|nr:sporulation protein YqfC [Clostridia bacterium]